jgi:hypothetical protein
VHINPQKPDIGLALSISEDETLAFLYPIWGKTLTIVDLETRGFKTHKMSEEIYQVNSFNKVEWLEDFTRKTST